MRSFRLSPISLRIRTGCVNRARPGLLCGGWSNPRTYRDCYNNPATLYGHATHWGKGALSSFRKRGEMSPDKRTCVYRAFTRA